MTSQREKERGFTSFFCSWS